jgi:hypothetical protein
MNRRRPLVAQRRASSSQAEGKTSSSKPYNVLDAPSHSRGFACVDSRHLERRRLERAAEEEVADAQRECNRRGAGGVAGELNLIWRSGSRAGLSGLLPFVPSLPPITTFAPAGNVFVGHQFVIRGEATSVDASASNTAVSYQI